MKNLTNNITLAVSLFLLLILAGCGGSEQATTGSPNVTLSINVPDGTSSGDSRQLAKYTHVPINSVQLTVLFSRYSTVSNEIIDTTGGTITRSFLLEEGTYDFIATAYDTAGGAGNMVYQGSTTADVNSSLLAVAISMVSTVPLQAAVDGVNIGFAELKALVNSKGTITEADVLPFHDVNYLDSGWDRSWAAKDMAYFTSGSRINVLNVYTTLSFNGSNLIEVGGYYSATEGGYTEQELFTETFKYDGTSGRWLLYGDQQIAEARLFFGTSRFISAFASIYDYTYPPDPLPEDIHWHVGAPFGTVSTIVLTSNLWTSPSVNFTKCGTWSDIPGLVKEVFCPDISIPSLLGYQHPAQSDTFTFAVTPSGGGTVVNQTQTIPANIPTDAPTINLPNTTAYHQTLTNFVGKTVSVPFTIPASLSYGEIDIEGTVCDSLNNCSDHLEGAVTSYNPATGEGTGVIYIPPNAAGNPVAIGEIRVQIHSQDYIFSECIYQFGMPPA